MLYHHQSREVSSACKRLPVLESGCGYLVFLSNFPFCLFLQINGKDMKIARHEDAVAMLTGGLSYVTLVVVRERVINKRMLPLSKLQDQSSINKRLGPKVSFKSLEP